MYIFFGHQVVSDLMNFSHVTKYLYPPAVDYKETTIGHRRETAPRILQPTGLMSRCKNPTEWMLSMASRIWRPRRRVVLMLNVPRGMLLLRSARFRP